MNKLTLFLQTGFFIFIVGCINNQQKNSAVQANVEKDSQSHSTDIVSSVAPKSMENQNAGCNDALWKNVYDPDRLEVIEKCKVVTGVIEESNADPDGDQHMLLKLDKGQKDLLTKKNKTKKDGDLVIEVVCVNNITRKRAKGACTGYTNNITLPAVGDHVRVTGSYVLDSHNGWNEIHPVSKIEKLK